MSAYDQEKRPARMRTTQWKGRLSRKDGDKRGNELTSEKSGNAPVALAEELGQGTTEYAILVGVLVVIAIMAIILFRDKVQELWNAIAEGVNSL